MHDSRPVIDRNDVYRTDAPTRAIARQRPDGRYTHVAEPAKDARADLVAGLERLVELQHERIAQLEESAARVASITSELESSIECIREELADMRDAAREGRAGNVTEHYKAIRSMLREIEGLTIEDLRALEAVGR